MYDDILYKNRQQVFWCGIHICGQSLWWSELMPYWHGWLFWWRPPCDLYPNHIFKSWWSYQMETFSALLAICAGNAPVPSEFPAQRPVKRNFDVFFDLRSNKLLNKQSWGWWFETPWHLLWRHRIEKADDLLHLIVLRILAQSQDYLILNFSIYE